MADSSVYPGVLDDATALPTDITNDTDEGDGTPRTGTVGWGAAWRNRVSSAIRKVEGTLGANPHGSFVDVAARLNAMLTCRKTADQNFTTTTLTSVTDMSLPVQAGGDYFFEFFVVAQAATAGVTQQHAVTVPALGAGGYVTYAEESFTQTAIATAGTDMVSTNVANASGVKLGGVGGTSIPAANERTLYRISGILSNPSVDGVIQLQAATETASTSTLKKGSFGRLYKN